jgi:outer membrane protein TolC
MGPAAGAVWAQEPGTYTLDDLIQIALERSPELREGEQKLEAAKYDLAQADAGRWAQLDATAVVAPAPDAHTPTVVVNPVPGPDGLLTGEIEENEEFDNNLGPFGRLDLTLSQPIYTFGKIEYRREAARQGVAAQKAALEQRRGEVVQKVKELYFGLIVARQGESAADDVNAFVEDARRRIDKLIELKAPNADPSDLYRLDTYAASIESFKSKAESGSRMAKMALQRTVGLPPGEEFKLDLNELPRDAIALASQEDYIRRAMQSRPELDQLKAGVEARRNLVDAAKADLYPSIFLALIGSFAYAPDRDKFEHDYIDDEYNHTRVGAFLGAKWHFDFGIEQAQLEKSRAELREILATRDFAEQNIPLEVMKYYQDALESQKAFMAYEKGAKSARKWVVSSFSNFDLGVGSAKDMFEAMDQYGKNQGEFLRALYNYHVALAKLSRAIGERLSETKK